MDILEAMKQRHSVRQYENKQIEEEKRSKLRKAISEINKEVGLNIQIFFDEPKCFDSMMAHYGKFSGPANYIAMVGRKGRDLDELCGYYGEKIVLLAQQLGLNTCWVAITHGKSAAIINRDERQAIIIAVGYGKTQGVRHQNKDRALLSKVYGNEPEWFKKGMEAVMLAPTALNQQKFFFETDGEQVTAKVAGIGFYTKMDLGIVKYHFEAVTGKKVK